MAWDTTIPRSRAYIQTEMRLLDAKFAAKDWDGFWSFFNSEYRADVNRYNRLLRALNELRAEEINEELTRMRANLET